MQNILHKIMIFVRNKNIRILKDMDKNVLINVKINRQFQKNTMQKI